MIGGKYTQADIVEGQRTLANGAVAGYVMNAEGKKVWRIVDASGVDMSGLRNAKDGRYSKKVLSPRAAKAAFNRHYSEKNVGEGKAFKSMRGMRQARTYDENHTKNVVSDARFRRNPAKYDFEGLDTGDKVRAPRSPAQRANDERLRANPPKRAMSGGADCKFNPATKRCGKEGTEHPEWCEAHVSPKGRNTCVKSKAGRKEAPKNSRPATEAQKAALARGRATAAANRAAKKAAADRE